MRGKRREKALMGRTEQGKALPEYSVKPKTTHEGTETALAKLDEMGAAISSTDFWIWQSKETSGIWCNRVFGYRPHAMQYAQLQDEGWELRRVRIQVQ